MNNRLAFALAYAILVLTVDTLTALHVRWGIDWSVFRWSAGGFDVFKFVAWLVVPLALSWKDLNLSWFTVRGWRRIDFAVLGFVLTVGCIAMAVVAVTPSLREIYPSLRDAPIGMRMEYAQHAILWTVSWLVGWEFLHRYWLLRRAVAVAPRWGWLIIPLLETAYHLQKPMPETFAMLAFSLVLTPWALTRRNTLLPFLAHFIIELELIAFMVLV